MAGEIEAGEGRGLSRRQLIKASAVAGAAAWTAPMIIDSLSSPAAAVSFCGPGCPNLSYGVVVYEKGGVFYQVKITGNTCAGGGVAGDGSGCLNVSCSGATWTNPSGRVHSNVTGDTTDGPSSGGVCTDITVHNSGGWVTANSGVTIILVFAHDGNVPDPVSDTCDHIGCVFCATDGTCAPFCHGFACPGGGTG